MAKIGAESPEPSRAFHAGEPIAPIDHGKGSPWIAGQLRQAILDGMYKFGEKLPAERQLAEVYGASRTTVRLALDQLETEKLLARRVGSGTFVSYRAAAETASIAEITSPLELIEVRLAIEPYMTRLAVLNATSRDLEKLEEACRHAEGAGNDPAKFTDWDTTFHVRIAEAAHNPLMLWLYQQVSEIRTHTQWAAMRDKILTNERITEYNHQHRALYAAIRSRDVEGAMAMVTSHLHYARRQLMGAEGA
jgi:DNA-binding FadR family transcriptional regulator